MSAPPWMPFYIGDYLAATTHLSTVQHGAYVLLICAYWQRGELPDDDEQLARICGLTLSEWKRHRPILRQLFKEGWRHGRVERELASAAEKYERRANAGKLGNKVRWGDRNAIPLGSQLQLQPQPQQKELSQGEKSLSGLGANTDEGTNRKVPTKAMVAAPQALGGRPRLVVANGEDGH